MEYHAHGARITTQEARLVFTGSLELADYTEVTQFLGQCETAIAAPGMIVDIRSLEFLNSNGLKMLAIFLAGSAKQFEVWVDPDVSWQENMMGTVRCLKPTHITVALKKGV